jgi:hypothetical protein
MPRKPGLYRMRVDPQDEDNLEQWLWDVWKRGNIGLFIDEVALVPQKHAFKAILRQGRSKLIPVIACTQRPVGCDREVSGGQTRHPSRSDLKTNDAAQKLLDKVIQEFNRTVAITTNLITTNQKIISSYPKMFEQMSNVVLKMKFYWFFEVQNIILLIFGVGLILMITTFLIY